MSYATSDQWGRRTDAEKFRDWNRAKMKRAAGTTQQPQENTNTRLRTAGLGINNLPPGYRLVKGSERKARIEAIRRIYGTDESEE